MITVLNLRNISRLSTDINKESDPLQAELLLYALIAAGLVFWLRSILGTRHGDERERPNPFTIQPDKQADIDGVKPVPSAFSADDDMPLSIDTRPVLPRNVSVEGGIATEDGLAMIGHQMRDFDIATFAQGAQDAFAIIVEAFAQGDRDTLQNLLTPHVYAAFDHALKQREQSGESVSTEIHSVRRAEIMGAEVVDGEARVTMRFIADETCVVRDKDGAILSGDPDRITEMNDIWTFARPLKSRDPRWLLHETRDGDVKEQERTPVPDSHIV